MELSLSHASEFLPAFIAHHAPRNLTFFKWCRLYAGICFFVRGRGAGDFFEGFVLVIFEPLESSLYCRYASALKPCKLEDKYLQPPVFLTAISARTFSKPMSMSNSKSEDPMMETVRHRSVDLLCRYARLKSRKEAKQTKLFCFVIGRRFRRCPSFTPNRRLGLGPTAARNNDVQL
jgi:hypothetical protein